MSSNPHCRKNHFHGAWIRYKEEVPAQLIIFGKELRLDDHGVIAHLAELYEHDVQDAISIASAGIDGISERFVKL